MARLGRRMLASNFYEAMEANQGDQKFFLIPFFLKNLVQNHEFQKIKWVFIAYTSYTYIMIYWPKTSKSSSCALRKILHILVTLRPISQGQYCTWMTFGTKNSVDCVIKVNFWSSQLIYNHFCCSVWNLIEL